MLPISHPSGVKAPGAPSGPRPGRWRSSGLALRLLSRPCRWLTPRWAAVAFLAVAGATTLVYYWPELVRGEAYLQSDALHGSIPFTLDIYREPSPEDGWLWTNSMLFGFSYARTAEAARAGYHCPTALLSRVLPTIVSMNLMRVLFSLLSLGFMWWFLGDLGVGAAARWVGALAFTFCGSVTQRYVHYPLQFAIWSTPVCFWLAERAAIRGSAAWLVLLGVVLGNSAFVGHPQFVAYQAPIVCLYYLCRRRQAEPAGGAKAWARSAGALGAVLVVFLGVTAVYWVPFAAQTQSFVGAGGRLFSTGGWMGPLKAALAHIAPRSVGSDLAHSGGPTLVDHSWEWSVYIGVVPLLFLPLSLTRAAQMRFRTVPFFFLLWLLSCCFLMNEWRVGGASFAELYGRIPVWNLFHHIYRFVFLGCFALSCLCAMGLQQFLDADARSTPAERSRVRWVPLAVAGGILLLAFLSTVVDESVRRQIIAWPTWTRLWELSGGSFQLHTSLASPMALYAAGAALFLLLNRWRLVGPRALVLLLTGMLSADLVAYGLPAKPTDPPETVWAPPPLVQAGIAAGQRVLSLTSRHYFDERGVPPHEQRRALSTNMAIFYGIEECGGYITLLMPPSFYGFYNLLGAHVPYRYSQGFHFRRPPDLPPLVPLLRACSIDYVITGGARNIPGLSLLARDRDLYAYRVEGSFPRAYTVSDVAVAPGPEKGVVLLARGVREQTLDLSKTAVVAASAAPPSGPFCPGEARLLHRRTTVARVEVNAQGQTFLVLTDAYRPQWHATVDGVPARVYQTNGIFRGVVVPAGRHIVEFRYRDPAYLTGKWLTLTTLGLSALFLAFWGLRRRFLRATQAA